MKLSKLEDSHKLVTNEYLDLRLHALENRLSSEFHKEILSATRWAITIMRSLLIPFGGIVLRGPYLMLAHFKP